MFPYEVHLPRRVARAKLIGTVRGAEIAETYRRILHDPRWQPGFDMLWDARGIRELLCERNDLADILAVQHEHSMLAGSGRDVILVHRTLDEVMAQMYEMLARDSPRKAQVCRSEQEVWAILGGPISGAVR